MNRKSKAEPFESVKIHKSVVNKVRKEKEKTGIPVSAFFERAAIKELKSKK